MTESDLNLILCAAMLAKIEVHVKRGHCKGGPFIGTFVNGEPWNPLTDDRDSRRLAIKLEISTIIGSHVVTAAVSDNGITHTHSEIFGHDKELSVRKAVLKVAELIVQLRSFDDQ